MSRNEIKRDASFYNPGLNCPNCGAPITGDRCEYCGTQFIDTTVDCNKPFYLKVRHNGTIFIEKVFVESMSVHVEPIDTIEVMDLCSDTVEYIRGFRNPTRTYTINYVSMA